MKTIDLVNVMINGVRFEDLTAKLRVDDGMPIMEAGGQFPYHRLEQYSMELYPDTRTDTALILYGVCTAVAHMNSDEGMKEPIMLTIKGTDKQAPWITYEAKGCWISEYQMVDSRYGNVVRNRIEQVTLQIRSEYTATVDEASKPKVHAFLTEEETSLIIATLMKEKTDGKGRNYNVAHHAIQHLQKALKGEHHGR